MTLVKLCQSASTYILPHTKRCKLNISKSQTNWLTTFCMTISHMIQQLNFHSLPLVQFVILELHKSSTLKTNISLCFYCCAHFIAISHQKCKTTISGNFESQCKVEKIIIPKGISSLNVKFMANDNHTQRVYLCYWLTHFVNEV